VFKWEVKVEKAKEDFDQISKTIKEEVKRFDLVRANEFRIEMTKYIEKLYQNQENVIRVWNWLGQNFI
jgi:sorting nexin-1/2